jgi:hypothetical protein
MFPLSVVRETSQLSGATPFWQGSYQTCSLPRPEPRKGHSALWPTLNLQDQVCIRTQLFVLRKSFFLLSDVFLIMQMENKL